LIVIVPPEKTIRADACTTPDALTAEMVVVPVKPVRAFSSDWPVLRPVRVVGAGTLLLALWARFS